MVKVLDRESINRMTRNSGRGGSTYVGGGGGGGYTLPLAADGTRGGVQIGYTTSAANRNYAVQLNNEKMYVNVPWVNTEDRLKPLGDITYGANYLQFQDVHASAASNPANAIGNPSADWYHHIIMNHGNTGGYFVDMAICFHSNEFYYRRIVNGTANAWVRVIDSSNIGNQSVNYATSAGSAGYATSAATASTLGGYYESDFLHKTGGTMTGNIYIGNTTIYASGTNGGINSLAVADDCILGDCNIGGHLGLKSLNTSYAGIAFYNQGGGYLGRIATTGTFELHDSNDNYANIQVNSGYAEGTWASKSDAREKNVLGDIDLTVEDIAAMPAVRFTWKNRADKQVHIGTLAQAWQKKLPEAVGRTENNRLTFSYGEAAAVCVVKLAQRVLELEEIVNEMRYGTQQH